MPTSMNYSPKISHTFLENIVKPVQSSCIPAQEFQVLPKSSKKKKNMALGDSSHKHRSGKSVPANMI